MITQSQRFSLAADVAAQRYGMLLDGFKATHSHALDAPHFGTQRQYLRAIGDAQALSERFAEGESDLIHEAMNQIASEALTATRAQLGVSQSSDMPGDVTEHVSSFAMYLSGEIGLQLARDIVTLGRALRDTTLRVTVASRAQRLPLQAALIQYRIAGNTAPLAFGYRDRRGANWTSTRYIRTIWRHNLLALYNDVVMMTLADHGLTSAFIAHEDPASEFHGMQIALIDSTSLPTYADIRDVAFHPNANAVVTGAL